MNEETHQYPLLMNELEYQLNTPLMDSQEQVVVFDSMSKDEEVPEEEEEEEEEESTPPGDIDDDGTNANNNNNNTPISTPTTSTAQRILSERFQSWKQQATEQASSSKFLSRMVKTYNASSVSSSSGAAPKTPSVHLNEEGEDLKRDDEDEEEAKRQVSDDGLSSEEDGSTDDSTEDDKQQTLRTEKLRVWSQTISESVSQQVSTFRGRYNESVAMDAAEGDTVDEDDEDEKGPLKTRYTVTLGRGMLGVNLKATFIERNGVYVDFVVQRGTGEREGIAVGDHVVALGDVFEAIQKGTVVSVPTAIAQAQRPVMITMAYYELMEPAELEDETNPNATNIPVLNHIDVAVALLNCDTDEEFGEMEVPDALQQQPGGCLAAILDPYSIDFPNRGQLVLYAQQRCLSLESTPYISTASLTNAALLTLADPRRTDFLAQHVAEMKLQHNLVLLAVELTLALELEKDWKPFMKEAVRDIASKYFLPASVGKAAGASFDSNESTEATTTTLQAPLLDVHSEFSQSELQMLEKHLDSDVSAAFGSLYRSVLARIDMRDFLTSDSAARMRGYLRGTVPYRNITATECWENIDYLQYCLAYWMQTNQTEPMCKALRQRRKRDSEATVDRVLYEYARNGHVQFRMSLYYEHLLNPQHSITDLWKHIEFPDHWSTHKRSLAVDEEDDPDTGESIYNAEMACVFRPGGSMIGCSFDPCNLDDCPAAGLLERYALPSAVVNFWLPREGMFGVALMVGDDEDSAGLALVSSQNVVIAMRETILKFLEELGEAKVLETLQRMLTESPTGEEEMELLTLLEPFRSAATSPWLDRPLESQKVAFVQKAGDQLQTSLPPIPLALLVLVALLEQKIVITSSRRSLLLSTTTALLELLRPLTWCHLMVPLVPDAAMAGDLLEYPAPFLLGWHTPPDSDFLELLRDLPEDVTLVDLDVGRVICGTMAELRSPLLSLAQRLGTDWAEKAYPDTWLCDRPVATTEFSNRPFSSFSTACHDFIGNDLLSHTLACCYEVKGTVYLNEAQFTQQTSRRVDPALVQVFLRSQAVNAYIATLDPKDMAFSLDHY